MHALVRATARSCRFFLLLFCLAAPTARADDDFWADWSARAHATLASEPHWIPPIIMPTPRLIQVVRYDQYWEAAGTGAAINSLDAGKGVEFIPLEDLSLVVNAPPYLERSVKSPAQGWGDWPFLTVKQRLAAAPEDQGDYVITATLGMQASLGNAAFTSHAWLFTPGLTFGEGWDDFNVQGNVGVGIASAHAGTVGTPVTANLVLQYQLLKYLWPEVEFNETAWSGGARNGLNQLYATFGVMVGNVPLRENYSLGIGLGYQSALSPHLVAAPLTPAYDHNWVLTLRLGY